MNREAFFKFSYGLYIVSTGYEGKMNGFIANSVFQVTSDPPQLATVCHKDNFTAQLIHKRKIYSVSVLQQDVKPKLIGLFGYKSGSQINKFETVEFILSKTGIPIVVEDALAWFECRVIQIVDVGTHWIFISEINDAELLNENQPPLTYQYYREVKKGKAPAHAPTHIHLK